MMDTIMHVLHLKKKYQTLEVLKDVSFDVKKGEIFGILGMNGAGKTTILEWLEGFLKYDEGQIEIHGQIGIQLQSSALPAYMKVKEAMKLFSKWKHAQLDEDIVKALGIQEIADQTYRELSTGQQRRLHLALALMGHPDLLFLDEPTAGLDVAGRKALHENIIQCQKQGMTVVLTSHDMNEVESLCDRIGILRQGKMAFIGTVEELAKQLGRYYYIKVNSQEGEEVYTTQHIQQTLMQICQDYQKQNLDILDMTVNRGTLEQHFLEVARRNEI